MGEGSHKYGSGRGNKPQRNNPKKKAALASRNGLSAEERRKRGEARLKVKGNINGGLTSEQIKAVSDFENQHRDRKTERVAVFDVNGKMVNKSTSGTRNRTRIRGAIPENSVITHNHPSSVRGDSTRYGSSLSGPDGIAAIRTNAAEVRAVSGNHTYSLRRPVKGWPINAKQYQSEWHAAKAKHEKSLRNYINQAKDKNDRIRRIQRANTLMSHMATRDVAKKYGIPYTRLKTK